MHFDLPGIVRQPSLQALQAFRDAALAAAPTLDRRAHCHVRWIGLDEESTRLIFELIRTGDKTGTFTLPWIFERTGQVAPEPGHQILLVDMEGRPTLYLRITDVRQRRFGEVTADDTRVDGSPVRDPAVWVPLHTQYWNGLLQPHNLTVTAEMPFWIESFELVYDADAVRESSASS